MIIKLFELVNFFYLSLDKAKRVKINFLLILMTISSVMEFLSIGSIVPLISIFIDYNFQSSSNFFIKIANNIFGDVENFRTFLISLFGFIVILAAIIRMIVFRIVLKVTGIISSDIASKVFVNTINQQYFDLIKQGTNVVISNVTEKNAKVGGVIYSLLNFFSGVIVTIGILIALIVHNFLLTVILIVTFSLLYLLIANVSKFYLKRNSFIVAKYSEYRIKFLQEALGNIRDIILANLYNTFSNIYFKSERKYRLAEANIATIAGYPKIILESVGIILLLVFCTLFFGETSDNNSKIIISLGVFAYAANRLLPMFNSIYIAWAQLLGNIDILEDLKLATSKTLKKTIDSKVVKKEFKKISFKDLSFSYNKNDGDVLTNINLSFNLNSKIGIVGKTGSGKSTFIDLIMGLLKPTSGKILIDENELNDDLISTWQNQISHVPQSIFLINDTIKNNITFNINETEVDIERLKQVIIYAELEDFINKSEKGLDTIVGENGINISGGQKQRIGIARALYKNKSILIMDEATSALDYDTENKIINNIMQNFPNISLLSITHRVNSLKDFSQIINLNDIYK
tara:strand:+ start:2004 stop:3725 length:1722 start_codon:yes stop_codon:yes gene_type:complete